MEDKEKLKILLAEDDRNLGNILRAYLEAKGFDTQLFINGQEAIDAYNKEIFDFCILDVMMPVKDGFTLAREIRALDKTIPILFLTAKSLQEDKLKGFEIGGDDYLTKPFRVEELVMRLRALVRRAAGHADTRIVCGSQAFDSQLGTFELDGLPLRLTALEWRVLSCLALRKDVVVDRAELIERVYEGDADVDSNSLEVIVARIRRKIGRDSIETVRGRGYRLTAGKP